MVIQIENCGECFNADELPCGCSELFCSLLSEIVDGDSIDRSCPFRSMEVGGV